jgi:hypothetical protein
MTTFLYKFTTQSQKKQEFPMPLHHKYYKEGTIVITYFYFFK